MIAFVCGPLTQKFLDIYCRKFLKFCLNGKLGQTKLQNWKVIKEHAFDNGVFHQIALREDC